MRQYTQTTYQKDKGFIFKLENQIMERSLLDQIGEWAKEVNMDICYCLKKMARSEASVNFGFLSEEDLIMFTLRWYSIIEKEYKNTLTHHIINLSEIIRKTSQK